MPRAKFPNFIGIRIEPELRAALDAQARKSGRSLSDLVRAHLCGLAQADRRPTTQSRIAA